MSRNLEDLHPYVKYLAEKFIEECKKQGIDILIYSTFRSKEEQNKLYEQGRSVPGNKVTNAKGGYSYHNYGLAFDCVPIINNKAQWDRVDLYERVGEIGKTMV
jgi:peptidoglycan L-alanyl-D-glutamate endopeptidase CwlK